MALERFIPKSPDPFIRNSQDFEVAKFGHLNTIIEYINSYVVTDSLQLAGSGPITSTARYITDTTGVNSAISISTIRVGIGTNTPSSELHIDGHSGFGASLKITTNKVNSVAYVQMISDYVTGFEQYQYGGPGWGWPNWTTNRSGGTAAAPTTAPNNYGLNEYAIWSYDGTGNGQGYAMITRTSETWTSTAHGIYTTFSTVATGSTSLVERMRFSAGGNITFNNASDTAKVSIKGSGSTSATIALLVQNSAGTEALRVRDDGSTVLYGLGINTSTNVGSVNMNLSASCIISTPITFQVKSGITDTAVFFVNGNNATPFSYFTGNTAIGSTTDLNARLAIKGSGSTSATTSLLVQNSAGNQLLKITDDGGYLFGINSVPQEFNFYGWNIVSLKINDSANGRTLSIYKNAGSNYLIDSNSDTRLSYGWSGNYFWRLNGQTKSMAMSSTVSDPTADASAIVDFQSTTKGFLPPRMTTAQRVAIASPINGLIVFDTDVQNLCYRRDGVWVQATFAAV
jgi:hypothetical protein